MSPISERPTPDIILLIVTLLVATAILMAGVGIFVIAIVHPEFPIRDAFEAFGQVIGLMIGSVLGYLAGKGRSPSSTER